eukprot:8720122-Alexandrium_andersonii.AAC.1
MALPAVGSVLAYALGTIKYVEPWGRPPVPSRKRDRSCGRTAWESKRCSHIDLSLIHISEPTRLALI